VLPHASAGPSFHEAMLSGKFRRDQSDDPERLMNVRSTPPATESSAVVLVDRTCVENEDLRDHAHLAARAAVGLPTFRDSMRDNFLVVLLDERRELVEQAGPVGRRRPPGREPPRARPRRPFRLR
jgi:hypothetical protein